MSHRLTITALFLGLISYFFSMIFGIDSRNIPYLQPLLYAAVVIGLYINVSGIDINSFQKHIKPIFTVLLLGVPIKIILPGAALAFLSPANAHIAYLCATVIAQIDPIAATKTLNYQRFSQKSDTILRVWSSFDDPVTVLFAFYIFLPIVLGRDLNFSGYLSYMWDDILVCIIVYYVYKKLHKNLQAVSRLKKIILDVTLLSISFLYSVFAATFLLPAVTGLFIRPFQDSELSKITDIIYYFSAVVIGSLTAKLTIDWYSGTILAVATFFCAHVIVTNIFIKDSFESKLRVMFSHQNGMTAILLTVAIEMSTTEIKNLFSVTLPAIILITVFYFGSNYLINKIFPSPITTQ